MFSRLAQVTLLALALTVSNQANAAPLAYGTYYDETVTTICGAGSFCRANFSQLPADKLLMVEKINCSIETSQPIIQATLAISAASGGSGLSRYLPLAVPPSQLIGGEYFTNWQTDTHFLVGNGRFPFVTTSVSSTTGWSMTCTMIGELVTPL